MPFSIDTPPEPKQTEHDVFSLEGLHAWLKSRNPDETYNVINPSACLFGVYASAYGGCHVGSGRYEAAGIHHMMTDLDRRIAGFEEGNYTGPAFTMGAALKRCEDAMKQGAK